MLVELGMVEPRYNALMAVLRDGEPVTGVANRFDIVPARIYGGV